MAVKVRINMKKNWVSSMEASTQSGLLELATDIHRRAIINAPKDTRALVNSGRVDRVSKGYSITFGSSRVPYARRRHFENKKNPQTKLYLFKAADSVMRGNLAKYWRGKI